MADAQSGFDFTPMLPDALRLTIMGLPRAASFAIEEDRFVLDFSEPISTRPRPELVSDVLRSGIPLSQAMLDALADGVDYGLKKKSRGPREKGTSANALRAAARVVHLMDHGEMVSKVMEGVNQKIVVNYSYENAIVKAGKEYGIGEESLKKIYKRYCVYFRHRGDF